MPQNVESITKIFVQHFHLLPNSKYLQRNVIAQSKFVL